MIELKNSKTQYLGKAAGRDRYAVDAFIGAVQMCEPGGVWQDIRPRLVRDADGWHIEGAPYYAEIKDSGARLFCPDRNERDKYLRLPAPPLFSGLSRNVVSNPDKLDTQLLPNQITMPADWGEFRVIFGNTGMHFEILFRGVPPSGLFGKDSPRILLDVEATGFDVGQLLNSIKGVGIPRPRLVTDNLEAVMSESQKKWLDWSYKNGQLELGFDFGNLPFPILLKNTTIDLQVGAGADDGYVYSTGNFYDTNTWIWIGAYGSTKLETWRRYTGITIPQGSTIDVAYESLYGWETGEGVLTKIYADDQNNPGAPVSQADYYSRTNTTAGVDQDGYLGYGFNNTPSLVSVIQELVNSYGYSNQAIQILHKDDSGTDYSRYYSWDYNDHSRAPKLHIEYTAGGATAKTAAETGTGAEDLVLQAAMSRGETAGGTDTRQSLLASLIKNESGTGLEQSLLTSFVAKLSAEAGSGIETRTLVARLASGDVGLGADTGVIPGLKGLFGGDGGTGYDALKALIGTSRVGSEIKLPGRQGQVKIPSREVSL